MAKRFSNYKKEESRGIRCTRRTSPGRKRETRRGSWVNLQAKEGKGRRGESEKSVKKETGRQERREEGGIRARKVREEYKQGGIMEKEDAEEKDKGRRGSIHSNSVVKATACPTARRYL